MSSYILKIVISNMMVNEIYRYRVHTIAKTISTRLLTLIASALLNLLAINS